VSVEQSQKVTWTAYRSGPIVTVENPGINLDWLDGKGIHILIRQGSPQDPLPVAMSVEFFADPGVIAADIPFRPGPHPIEFPPSVLRRLESAGAQPIRSR
jgi:hypothetical protein